MERRAAAGAAAMSALLPRRCASAGDFGPLRQRLAAPLCTISDRYSGARSAARAIPPLRPTSAAPAFLLSSSASAARAAATSTISLQGWTGPDIVACHARFLPPSPEGFDALGGGVRSAGWPLAGASATVSPSPAFLWSGQHLQSRLHRHRCKLNTAEPPSMTHAHAGSRLRHMLPRDGRRHSNAHHVRHRRLRSSRLDPQDPALSPRRQ
jgi:hypothetical protein